MNEEKKKRKLEERRIKEVNASLKYLSSLAQKQLGILAVQEQDNVFFCEDKRYKKVYTVRPAVLQNKKYVIPYFIIPNICFCFSTYSSENS